VRQLFVVLLYRDADPHGSEFHDAADFVDEVIALSEEIGHSSKLRALRE